MDRFVHNWVSRRPREVNLSSARNRGRSCPHFCPDLISDNPDQESGCPTYSLFRSTARRGILAIRTWSMMALTYDRDLIGYGANPPDPKWPGGARLAINFVINYEEGSEPSVQDGEGYTETGLTEASDAPRGVKGRDLAG